MRGPAIASLALALPLLASAQEIPKSPELLRFEPIVFEPPEARAHRVVLKGGIVAFVREDRTLPLVNISLQVRTGSWLEPEGKEGLAALTGAQMRRGGTRDLSAEALDERLDFLAAQVGTSIGETSAQASLNCLKDNLDESLRLFVEVLRHPRFQEDRLALAKEQALQAMSKRNDESADIEAREWGTLLYGEEHFTNRFSTETSLAAITRDDLVAFHRRYFQPSSFILAVSGAVSRGEVLAKLEAAFAGWPWARPQLPAVPSAIAPQAPGLYRIQKDVNQGRVSIGLPSVMRTSPDIYALEVMNEILGGSGFTSRITRTVRSNEGLAYSAGSGISFGVYYPGRFRAGFQSKSRSVAYATQLVFEEIRGIRERPVSDQELETVKRSLIETFPSNFASAAQVVSIFASDEYTGREASYWRTYRDRIAAVSKQDVLRVAREHLVPERMIVLVVGDQQEIDLGDPKQPVTLASLAPAGRVVSLPLRDPLSMRR
jgi:predicted Zn-dependent peptidase